MPLTEKSMNTQFEKIWDNQIRARLSTGELITEMDVQAAFHMELESSGLIGGDVSNWRCYHDCLVLKPGYRFRYDMVLMKYTSKKDPKKHYPAIVTEFKLWNGSIGAFNKDFDKLERLRGKDYPLRTKKADGFPKRPYAYHLMYTVDLRKKVQRHAWHQNLLRFKPSSKYQVKVHKYLTDEANEIMKNNMNWAQWCRHEGDLKRMDWIATPTKPFKDREIWHVRVSRILR